MTFKTSTEVGVDISFKSLKENFDAIVMSGGAEDARMLNIPGFEMNGVRLAMEFLTQQNKRNAGDDELRAAPRGSLTATGKHVVVIGGGDTGSDCVGTSNRQGAASVTQIEIMPQPPEMENKLLTWPDWPMKLRTSSSHEEGVDRDWAVLTKEVVGENGLVTGLKCVRADWDDGQLKEVEGSEFVIRADLILLAMGFLGPQQGRSARPGGRHARPTAAMSTRIRTTTRPAKTWCSPAATCAGGRAWSSGRSAKAGNARGRWTKR